MELAHRARAIAPENDSINWTAEILSARKENAELLKDCSTKVISLGSDCLPRTVLTRWGIKPSRAQGELSCPFDLAGCTYDGVLRLLRDDFKDLVNPDCLKMLSSHNAHFGIPMPANHQYGLTFNHERGDYWIEDDFKNLISRYRKRVDNFYQYIKSHPVLFVFHDWQGAFSANMSSLLSRKFGAYDYELLVLNTSEKAFQHSLKTSERVTILYVPLPSEAVSGHYLLSMSQKKASPRA